MIARNLFPPDPIAWREDVKHLTRASMFRPALVFIWSYFVKLGFLDGVAGFDYALARASYARDVLKNLRAIQ